MQPNDQNQYQPTEPVPGQAGPVVTLSPDQTQQEVASQQPEAPAGEVTPSSEPIRWQAPEYIQGDKDQMWIVYFMIVTLGLTALAIFVIKSLTFAVLIPVMTVALVMYTRRPPRILDYTLSRQGLHINDELFPYGEFKSFALVHGLDQYSIMLVPVKRFKPAVAINFPQEAGEAIVDMLAPRLPMREVQPDIVDQIIRKLRL